MNSKDTISEPELFPHLSRTERQKEALRRWLLNRGIGSIVASTGFGKTRVALMSIQVLLKKFPNLRVLVVVPQESLQKQWITELDALGLGLNCEVLIINTASKGPRTCDYLIIDEAHRAAATSFANVFKIKYRFIMCLSATLERLDGKHTLILKYAPVVDNITSAEAVANGWIAKSTEYCVLLDVPDIAVYQDLTKVFDEHFEFFAQNFKLVMQCLGKDGYKHRIAYAKLLCPEGTREEQLQMLKTVTYHAMGFSKAMQARKKFINEHPDKIRLTQEIIKHRADKKIITFSATVDIASKIGGNVYSTRNSKKSGAKIINDFAAAPSGVLNTVSKANEGLDVPNLSVAVILGQDSSNTKLIQRVGRVSRVEGDKIAEVFTFVINHSSECNWFESSHKDREYIKISEEGLMHVLKGEPFEPYRRKLFNFTFKY